MLKRFHFGFLLLQFQQILGANMFIELMHHIIQFAGNHAVFVAPIGSGETRREIRRLHSLDGVDDVP
ncbi:hypothetical protein D3C81_825650 [compost metagenome]